MQDATFDPKHFLGTVTQAPGVYRFYAKDGTILYVGKAKNLKKRLSSYFQKQLTGKTQRLMEQVAWAEVSVTETEKDALILESALIKANRPRYNILLRDDKSYPYLCISHGSFPRLYAYRGPKKASLGEFYGPYPSVLAVRDMLNLMQKGFQVRSCTDSFFKNRSRPCLQYQIGRCSAPCVNKVTEAEYERTIKQLKSFLLGKRTSIVSDLVEQMEQASENQAYEEAGRLRDLIRSIQKVREQQHIEGKGSIDVLAIASEGPQSVIHRMQVRQGMVISARNHHLNAPLNQEPATVMADFVRAYYIEDDRADIPEAFGVNQLPVKHQVLKDCLSDKGKHTPDWVAQPREQRRHWLMLAEKSAREALQSKQQKVDQTQSRFQALSDSLGDQAITGAICFDVSHFQGEATMASAVVFSLEGPQKSAWRRITIKEAKKGDDVAAMKEAVKHYFSDAKAKGDWLPNLLLIDGGKTQLASAKLALEEVGLLDILIIGVAKGPTRRSGNEILWRLLPDETLAEVELPIHHGGRYLIQAIRDESHRFALKAHRQKRDKKRKQSPLEGINGIGPKKRQTLLTHLGGLEGVKNASIEVLASVPGISEALARTVYEHLHPKH